MKKLYCSLLFVLAIHTTIAQNVPVSVPCVITPFWLMTTAEGTDIVACDCVYLNERISSLDFQLYTVNQTVATQRAELTQNALLINNQIAQINNLGGQVTTLQMQHQRDLALIAALRIKVAKLVSDSTNLANDNNNLRIKLATKVLEIFALRTTLVKFMWGYVLEKTKNKALSLYLAELKKEVDELRRRVFQYSLALMASDTDGKNAVPITLFSDISLSDPVNVPTKTLSRSVRVKKAETLSLRIDVGPLRQGESIVFHIIVKDKNGVPIYDSQNPVYASYRPNLSNLVRLDWREKNTEIPLDITNSGRSTVGAKGPKLDKKEIYTLEVSYNSSGSVSNTKTFYFTLKNKL